MKKTLLLCLLLPLFIACEQGSNHASSVSYFVTTLGSDTLALERFEKKGNTLFADVILRSPRTSLSHYELILTPQGGIADLTRFRPAENAGFDINGAEVIQKTVLTGDSLISNYTTNNGNRRLAAFNVEGTLPFIDMVHWPFELALTDMAKGEPDSVFQKMLTGRRVADFIMHRRSTDSITLRHPSRGVMGIKVDKNGHLLSLDAGLTTRKLIVQRTDELDFERLAQDFVARDKNGSPFGALSGAVEETFSFKGAEFKVQYGSPRRRGRTLFGGIVSWGQRWRTGANRATHFSTSKDLKIGDLNVPAGDYTLFTIPEADGGALIINKQTGQNGRTYDQERDLGRVPMTISEKEDNTEAFTIRVDENGTGGSLKLIWGNTVFSVDFEIN